MQSYQNTVEQKMLEARLFNKEKTSLNLQEKILLKEEIKDKLRVMNASIICHYYVDGIVQDLAIESGGIVADSLEMARYGQRSSADILIVAGVKFMGETAKILSPQKKVFMVNNMATCSLDVGCSFDDFNEFCDNNPSRTVLVYANTSASIKARSDWTVTSSCAIDIVEYLASKKLPLIFAPDKHLGNYIKKMTGADILNWEGHCVVHDEFKSFELKKLSKNMPEAEILVHPEAPNSVIELADCVGSTSQLLKYSKQSKCKTFIVATDNGLIHAMKKSSPKKSFIEAPTAGNGATCKSCAHCPWMEMNDLKGVLNALGGNAEEIIVQNETSEKAMKSITKMLNFTR
ncbi:MAG: quinolinate synthase [Betaproteobacteria bacterium TMED82]|nr:MAG: quinolinate synthase [Betaproteobacteria bacterium TMED82]